MDSYDFPQDALATVSAWGPFFAVRTHDSMPQPPWRPVDDPEVLRDRVITVHRYLANGRDLPVRVAASVAQLGLVARLISPVLAVSVLTGRILDLSDAWWQPDVGGAFPLSITGSDGNPQAVIQRLVDATRAFSVSERILWDNVASALNGAATMIAGARPDLAARSATIVSGLLELPPLRNTSTRTDDGRFRRLSCCLIYRATTAVCGDCVLAGQPGERQWSPR